MEPVLYRLGFKPREVDQVLLEETVSDVRAMVDGSAWRIAWQTTQQMNSTGNFKPPVEVEQLRRLLLHDLLEPAEEPEEVPEPEPPVNPERAARAKAALDAALAERAIRDRARSGGITVEGDDAPKAAEPEAETSA